MSQEDGLPFRIRKLPPSSPSHPEPLEPLEAVPLARPQEPLPAAMSGESHTGGLFDDAHKALHFLGVVAGTGLADHAQAWHNCAKKLWWVTVAVPWNRAASLVAASHGQPFAGLNDLWAPVPAHGSLESTPSQPSPALGNGWNHADLHTLLVGARLRPTVRMDANQVVVLTPGPLARLVLRRAAEYGLSVQMTPVTRTPLAGGQEASAAMLRLEWRSERPPQAFLTAVARLPYTLVARSVGMHTNVDGDQQDTLWVDIRYSPPLGEILLASLVTPGEAWFLGGGDVGHWRVILAGEPVDGASMLTLPPMATPATMTESFAKPQATPIPLRLVPLAPPSGFPDAVLLDDAELQWLQVFMRGRVLPQGEELPHLIPGPGQHLLVAAGGLLARTPFGLPLRRHGRGRLLVQEGWGFFPPLATSAQVENFSCAENEVITVTQTPGNAEMVAARFQLDAAIPLWSLWLSTPPTVTQGIQGEAAQRLLRLAKILKMPPPKKNPGILGRLFAKSTPPEEEHENIRRQARQAENANNWVQAAELLESIGDHVRAGRLFERAAKG